MRSRWNSSEAKSFIKKYARQGEDLALRTYSARLIGQDRELVLHGGGNTSVKTTARSIIGESIPVLCVKGSGWNLDTIEPAGQPAIRLDALRRLRSLRVLSDEDMMNQFRIHMLESSGPNPSVETLLHAFLPHKFIDHSHANAVLSLVDQPDAARVRDWVKGRMGVVPYIMPGFALAKLAADVFEKDRRVEGLILLKHGIFTFGDTAQESYERMIHWVNSAERTLAKNRPAPLTAAYRGPAADTNAIGRVANMVRGQTGMIVRHRATPAILRFVNSRESASWSQRGPATPDHVIRTKPVPLRLPAYGQKDEDFRNSLQTAIKNFKQDYQNYFTRQSRLKKVIRKPLDPLPRMVLVPGAGLFAPADNAQAADIALDIYETTIGIMEKASRIGRYQPIPQGDIFDMEYWSLEQAKLGQALTQPFNQKVVWISGAASGIGRATAQAFGAQGAHVFMTDRDAKSLKKAVAALSLKHQAVWGICDVTNARQVRASFSACSTVFGGVDMVVSNAGVAPSGEMATTADDVLRKSFEINFFAHQNVARAAVEVFRRQKRGGVLLFNASKSTFNPGPGFGPYTLPKASVVALMKQYAVELGAEGIRSNAVNADRVRTGLFAGGLLEKRAKARGINVTEYMSGNLLKEEVYPEDVAAAFVWLAQANKTTGAVVPVDGGNAAAFPR